MDMKVFHRIAKPCKNPSLARLGIVKSRSDIDNAAIYVPGFDSRNTRSVLANADDLDCTQAPPLIDRNAVYKPLGD